MHVYQVQVQVQVQMQVHETRASWAMAIVIAVIARRGSLAAVQVLVQEQVQLLREPPQTSVARDSFS